MALRKFIIERDIPKVGTLERDQLRAAAAKSNEVLCHSAPTSNGLRAMSQTTRHSAFISPRTKQSFASTPRSAVFRQPRSPKASKMMTPLPRRRHNSRRVNVAKRTKRARS